MDTCRRVFVVESKVSAPSPLLDLFLTLEPPNSQLASETEPKLFSIQNL